MGDFFKPWRRKVGLVALAMALGIIGIWYRSRWHQDDVRFRLSKHTAIEVQTYGRCVALIWMRDGGMDFKKRWGHEAIESPFYPMNLFCEWNSDNEMDPNSIGPVGHVNWRREWYVFRFGTENRPAKVSWLLSVPYWVIITSISLTAAYLLLTKPHKSTLKKNTEPIPENVE